MFALARLPAALGTRATARAVIAITLAVVFWEIGSRFGDWTGARLPFIGVVPPPSRVLSVWYNLIGDYGYWQSWYLSFLRVLGGFGAAMVLGIPFGMALALNRTFYQTAFPTFEVLRPIPPLAWVPAAILFWPTQELSIAFITFLGAFYTIVINVVGGARSIDARYIQSAYAMGASRWTVFRRVVLPSTLPSIIVGASVGMGVTWEVVVAAEMISGGGSSMGSGTGGTGGGLGFFIWNSYTGGSYEQIIVGMISIGIAGYISSSAIRALGRQDRAMVEATITRAGTMKEKSVGGELEVCDVSKSYGTDRYPKTVVDNCSFTVERSKLTVMIGPSGSGKSTIVRLLASFEQPTSGAVLLDGKKVTKPDRERLVVFQESALYPWMTTYENVVFGPKAQGRQGASLADAARDAIDRVGLNQFQKSYPNQLSGGMQRRAELARALINDPAVMILDEPFRGLDAMTKGLMQEYYAQLFESSRNTHLFITTDIDEAIFLADRLLIMSNFPLRLRQVIKVDLPRPRRLVDVVTSDTANQLKMTALSILHEEALKSFAVGNQSADHLIESYKQRYRAGPN